MHVTLTIQEKLKDLRVERGLSLEQLAEQTGISKSSLGNYETDDYKDISHTSIVTLAKFYEVSTDYLLGLTENKNRPNAGLADLHLSDSMIELLKSGKINTRLFCEMVLHKGFIKLLADIEIYVDGIAGMQIQSLNAWVDVIRKEIMDRYQPGEEDTNIRTLEAACIQEEEYFRQLVHGDIDQIIKDIKAAHRNDSTSAPEVSAVSELKQSMEEAASFQGSPQEKRAVLFCRQLGIDYTRLTPEEFRVTMKVLEKSRHLKNPGRGRKRGRKRK